MWKRRKMRIQSKRRMVERKRRDEADVDNKAKLLFVYTVSVSDDVFLKGSVLSSGLTAYLLVISFPDSHI